MDPSQRSRRRLNAWPRSSIISAGYLVSPNPNSGQRGHSNLSIALAISQHAQIPSLQTVRIEIGMLGALVRVATLHQQGVFQLVADAVQLVRELQELAIAAGVAPHLVLVVPDMHVQLRQGDDDSKQVGRCLDA